MEREFIFTNKWSDLVFENRNQSYGAYVLRKRLPDNILIGYITALIFMGSVLFIGYQCSKISIADIGRIMDTGTVTPFDGTLKPPSVVPNIKSDQKIHPSKPSTENAVPIVKDSVIETPEKEKTETGLISEVKDTFGTDNNFNGKNLNGKNEMPFTNSVEPYDLGGVQKIPEFKGGISAMMKFIRYHVTYPEKYLANGDGGTVYVSFVIDTAGRVTQVIAKSEINGFPEFTNVALQAVSKMPLWIPGQQNGKNVPVILTLPIKFSPIKGF